MRDYFSYLYNLLGIRNTIKKNLVSLLLGVGGGGGSLLSGDRYFRGGGVATLGIYQQPQKLTLISGGCYFRGVVSIGTLRYLC